MKRPWIDEVFSALSQHFPEFAVIPLRFFQNESRARIDWTEGGGSLLLSRKGDGAELVSA